MKLIYVHTDTPLVGDTICTLPFLRYLHEFLDAEIVVGPRFNQWVYDSLDAPWLMFDPQLSHARRAIPYVLDADTAMKIGAQTGLHMSQAHFARYSFTVPNLPFDLRDMFKEPDAQCAGDFIAIAPFSRTDIDGNKAWSLARWAEFAIRIKPNFGRDALAFGSFDDFASARELRYQVTPVAGRPLYAVLAAFRAACAVVTIDTGLSHLCHFGGIKHHALLYPACLAPGFVHNPHAAATLRAHPRDVTVDDMLRLTERAMAAKL